MGWNLPPGVTDRMIDEVAGASVQCDNCHKMFDPDGDEDCFVGYHRIYGDVCQCGKCCTEAWRAYLTRRETK